MTANERLGTIDTSSARSRRASRGMESRGMESRGRIRTFLGLFSAMEDGMADGGSFSTRLPARGFALVLVALVVVATFRVVVGGIRRRTRRPGGRGREARPIAELREWRCAPRDGSFRVSSEEDDEAKTLVDEDDVFEDAFPAAGDEPISYGDFDQRL